MIDAARQVLPDVPHGACFDTAFTRPCRQPRVREHLADLRTWNLGLTVLHAAQAVLILVLASGFAITVTSTFPQGPPGTRLTTPEDLFDVPIGPALAVFLLLAAFDHLTTATFARRTYESDLAEASIGSGGWSTRSAPR